MILAAGIVIAGTVFLFKHPENFSFWCAFVGSIFGVYHWLIIRDSKVPDAYRDPR